MPQRIPITNAAEARARLNAGNEAFRLMGEVGTEHVLAAYPIAASVGTGSGSPKHDPFAAVIGCSDARVPVEFVFGQAANDLFVIRVAGNVLASGVTGSVQYAASNLPSVQVVVVLGHTSCGGLTAAVDAMLSPNAYMELVHSPEMRSIVDSLLVGVRMASLALREEGGEDVVARPGYREALIDVSAAANAAINAHVLSHAIDLDVAFGVFDLESRSVGLASEEGWTPGLADPPHGNDQISEMLRHYAAWALGRLG